MYIGEAGAVMKVTEFLLISKTEHIRCQIFRSRIRISVVKEGYPTPLGLVTGARNYNGFNQAVID